ncbi:unnamed protein product [Schistosoma curassoni]|uniref:Uncharacterized protein n=1 Tax=Schistosoma curassoni TaxID=6186 RepID=A0A183JPI6_9TREM|nr:unnamed protein product [Schistosoma curassoni]
MKIVTYDTYKQFNRLFYKIYFMLKTRLLWFFHQCSISRLSFNCNYMNISKIYKTFQIE